MNTTLTHANFAEEARLLYALLDAMDYLELIGDPALLQRARQAKRRAEATSYDEEAEALYLLLDELERSGAMAGTWVQKRWLISKARIEGA